MTSIGNEDIWEVGIDIAIEVSSRSIGTFGTERVVLIPLVEVTVKSELDSAVVEGDKDLGKVCVFSEMEKVTEVTSG